MRILLQFPEGLKKEALTEAERLRKHGHEVFISSSQCFGACDIALDEARALGIQKIIHYGHADFGVKSKIPIEYVEYPIKIHWRGVLKKALPELRKYKKIALVTTVQHISQLKEIADFLRANGKQALIKKGTKAKYAGQILGCDVSAIDEEADCVLYVGGGIFHALVGAEKPVLAADPFSSSVRWMNDEIARERKRNMAALSLLMQAKNVGILVSTKPGQMQLNLARKIAGELRASGKNAFILVSNQIDYEALSNLSGFDAFVNTACPRITEDRERIRAPIANAKDALELLWEMKVAKEIKNKNENKK
ncbi:MAG: diphthamide biosynthesis enzyme Dph2 [Candidatus Micrarchaeota archaeon]|nr:diphthamide biosynthesis enzyme Dph2 [Candidatus Micrarchaeota archaeon]